jgi:hypothetical protein
MGLIGHDSPIEASTKRNEPRGCRWVCREADRQDLDRIGRRHPNPGGKQMKSRTVFSSAAAIAILLIASFGISSATGQQASQSGTKYKNVYWLSLSGTSSVAPDYVFFTANSGGFVKNVRWKHWGTKKTVGRGTFGTTAPCNGRPCPKGPARLVLRKPVKCTPAFGDKQGKRIRVYRRGTLYYPNWNGKRLVANISDRTGWGACRQSYR